MTEYLIAKTTVVLVYRKFHWITACDFMIIDSVSVGHYCYRSVRVRKSLGLVTQAPWHPLVSKIICESGA